MPFYHVSRITRQADAFLSSRSSNMPLGMISESLTTVLGTHRTMHRFPSIFVEISGTVQNETTLRFLSFVDMGSTLGIWRLFPPFHPLV